MAASKVVAVKHETGDATVGPGPFELSVWGDFFLTYNPPPSQRSEDWMRERSDQLKGEVHRMFEAGKDMSVAEMVRLVDTLERLGIDNHFKEEIHAALNRVHSDQELVFDSSNDLHVVALRFRLLRQHGFWVSTDVFNKFRAGTRSFSIEVSSDPVGLLSMYNAAHMAVPGETVLDDAIAFARRHLEDSKGKLSSPMEEQVSRALKIPRTRFMRRLETAYYITEYEQEGLHDTTILELARLDFNLVRSLHLKELRTLSLWWRNLYDDVKLSYARDRIVEAYFYTCGIFHEEENSRARIMLAKVFGLIALIDDTFDVHGTLEECQMLDEAIQRWDESVVSILPGYLRMLYIKTLITFKEIEDILEPYEKYRMDYVLKEFKLQSKLYLQEAKWFSKNYTPSFKEHLDVSIKSTSLQTLFLVALMGAGQMVTKEEFDWSLDEPDMLCAMAEIGRFLNDITSYKHGKNKKDVATSVECYMKEHDTTGQEAMAAISAMVEHAWRRINWACIEIEHAILPVAQLVVKVAGTLEVLYRHGRDGVTYGRELKELVSMVFLKDVPV